MNKILEQKQNILTKELTDSVDHFKQIRDEKCKDKERLMEMNSHISSLKKELVRLELEKQDSNNSLMSGYEIENVQIQLQEKEREIA